MQKEIQFIKLQPADEYSDGKKVQIMLDIPVPRIRTQFNSKWYIKNQEINTEPSLTIPDQAMTVMEIMQRFASGLPVNGLKIPMYEEEEGDYTDLQKMDLAERQEYLEMKMAELKEVTERVNKRKQTAQQIALDKIISERVQKKLDEQKGEKPV